MDKQKLSRELEGSIDIAEYMPELSPKAQILYDRDMEIINYEVARENVHAVKGQYIRETYREEEKQMQDKVYLKSLGNELDKIQDTLDFMYELTPEKVKQSRNEYGELYKKNKKLIDNRQRLL